VVHAHQVLPHLRDPLGAMTAMSRLVRPGGIVAARDSDYGAFVWSPAHPGLVRWREVYSAVARDGIGVPASARCPRMSAHIQPRRCQNCGQIQGAARMTEKVPEERGRRGLDPAVARVIEPWRRHKRRSAR
jgi:hypothetical protein